MIYISSYIIIRMPISFIIIIIILHRRNKNYIICLGLKTNIFQTNQTIDFWSTSRLCRYFKLKPAIHIWRRVPFEFIYRHRHRHLSGQSTQFTIQSLTFFSPPRISYRLLPTTSSGIAIFCVRKGKWIYRNRSWLRDILHTLWP